MTKSSVPRRGFLPLILIAAPGALAAQTMTPEEAIARQQAEIREVVSQACPEASPTGDPNDVVVCGRREQRSRYRIPAELAESARPREMAGGEQRDALAGDICLRLCSQPVMVNVVGISADGVTGAIPDIGRAVDRLLHPD